MCLIKIFFMVKGPIIEILKTRLYLEFFKSPLPPNPNQNMLIFFICPDFKYRSPLFIGNNFEKTCIFAVQFFNYGKIVESVKCYPLVYKVCYTYCHYLTKILHLTHILFAQNVIFKFEKPIQNFIPILEEFNDDCILK